MEMEMVSEGPASVSIPGSELEGASAVYVSSALPIELDRVPATHVQSPFEAFLKSCKKFPDTPMLGKRKTILLNGVKRESYQWQTYSEVFKQIGEFGVGLSGLLSSSTNKMYGICSRARPEWLVADLAGQGYGMVSVTLYVDYEPEALCHVFKETKISVLVCDLESIGPFIFNAHKLPSLKTLISMDELSGSDSQVHHLKLWGLEKGLSILDMEQVKKLGVKRGGTMITSLLSPIQPDQLLTVAYTSGTTDLPKGVMLGGQQFAAVMFSLTVIYPVSSRPKLVYRMEFLPYARVSFRARAYFAISRGQSLGFYSGMEEEPEKKFQLLEDICILRPHILPMDSSTVVVLRSAIKHHLQTLNPSLRELFEALLEKKTRLLNNRFDMDSPQKEPSLNIKRLIEHEWSEHLVFGPVRRMLGGNVEVISHGSRPLLKEDIDFLRIVLGAHIVQAYGSTETCGQGFSTTSNGSFISGFVGGVAPLIQAKMVDCHELEYAVTDRPYPRGEVWLKGPSLFQGYFSLNSNDKFPKRVFKDGWYPTGDIAALDPLRGQFAIIDRKINFFKIADGVYITPDKLEKAYSKLNIVSEIYVPTEKGRNSAVAIIVPELREFIDWVSYHFQKPTAPSDFVSLCQDDSITKAFCSAINTLITQYKLLANTELLKAVYLEPASFKSNKELVTPSKKLKRTILHKKYAAIIDGLYNQSNSKPESDSDQGSSKSNSYTRQRKYPASSKL